MNRALLIAALVVSSVIGGCASFPEIEDRSEMDRLRARNAELERAMAHSGGESVQQPAAGERRIMPRVPRPDFFGGRPQLVGQLYSPIQGCEKSGRSIEIKNSFGDNHLRIFLDGREVFVGGAVGRLPTLPPDETVFLCVTPGAHKITAIALEPAGLTELPGDLRSGSVKFSTGARPKLLRFSYADFALSD
jgi:hypothetical protein